MTETKLYWGTNRDRPNRERTARGRILHLSDDAKLTLCSMEVTEEADDLDRSTRRVCRNCLDIREVNDNPPEELRVDFPIVADSQQITKEPFSSYLDRLCKKYPKLRVKHVKQTLESIRCPECGGSMTIRDSRFGPFYGCAKFPKCLSSHGMHPEGKPLGIPANRETKEARIRAHAAFDRLWKDGGPMGKAVAYAWMQQQMGLSSGGAHIARFDLYQCNRLIGLVRAYETGSNPDEGLPTLEDIVFGSGL